MGVARARVAAARIHRGDTLAARMRTLAFAFASAALLLTVPASSQGAETNAPKTKDAAKPDKDPASFDKAVGKTPAVRSFKGPEGRRHFSVTTGRHKTASVVTGSVCTGDETEISDLKRVGLEESDVVSIGKLKKCIHFTLKINGQVDGFSYRTDAKLVEHTVKVNGKPLGQDRLFCDSTHKSTTECRKVGICCAD